MQDFNEVEYVGFWMRVWTSIIDTFLISIITVPILISIYGAEGYTNLDTPIEGSMGFLINWVFPFLAIILFWIYCQATPGKMVISAKIVDAETGEKPSVGQCIGRYVAYIPSILFFGVGFLWVAVDKKKQGWHDKLAGTVVVRKKDVLDTL